MNKIGIRHEDKYQMERRTPVVPADLKKLISAQNISFTVEPSGKRIFGDDEFRKAGAEISDNLKTCDVIMGVKEMPEGYFDAGKVYIYFSHVIKGQPYNMPMLKSLMDAGATLIDYEKIADKQGRRLIFFGRYAGLAGMISTLWTIGKRYRKLGIPNPFEHIKQACTYPSLEDAKNDIRKTGADIEKNGLPPEMSPLVVAVTGDGNVSQGALEIAGLLPFENIPVGALPAQRKNPLALVNLTVDDYTHHNGGRSFDLNHYIQNPEEYTSEFESILPQINVLVNGIYWDERYPKLVTKSYLKKMAETGNNHLKIIGDITCDPEGSIECTLKATEIEDPVFVYHPDSETITMGFEGDGVAVMAVDILPSELPRESSEHFSQALMPFMPEIAKADFTADFKNLDLPAPIKNAVIVHKGKLTPDYAYLLDKVG